MLDIYYNAFKTMDFLNVQIDGEYVLLDIPHVHQITNDLEKTLRSLFHEYRMTRDNDLEIMNLTPPCT